MISSIRLWQENMVERGFEEPQRNKRKDEGKFTIFFNFFLCRNGADLFRYDEFISNSSAKKNC